MLETPDVPPAARVMRVQPRPDERPVTGFSWADYEDVDGSGVTADDADGEDDGGWIVQSSRGRPGESMNCRGLDLSHTSHRTKGTTIDAKRSRIINEEAAAEPCKE